MTKKKIRKFNKKLAALLICALISTCLTACGKKSTQTRYFARDVNAYTDVARFFLNNYEWIVSEKKGNILGFDRSDYLLIDFSDYRGAAGDISESYSNTMAEFAFAWLKEDTVIFWEDTTKTLGVMYALKPDSALNGWKSQIKNMDSEEINDHMYTIGTWDRE